MNWREFSIRPVFARLLGLQKGIIRLMDLSIAPTRNRIDFTQQEEALAQIFALQSQLAERDAKLIERDAELKRRELKIQQLTLELAHHKRIRFGCKSEALSPEQRDLFVESCDEDGAAIVAELEQQQKPAAAPRAHKRSGRNPLPPELPRINRKRAARPREVTVRSVVAGPCAGVAGNRSDCSGRSAASPGFRATKRQGQVH